MSESNGKSEPPCTPDQVSMMIKAIAILLFGIVAINAQHYAYGRRGGIIGGRKGIIGGGHGGKIIGGYGHHGSTWGQNHGGFVSERRIDSGVVGGGVIGGGVIGGGAVGGGIIGGGAIGGGIVGGGVIGGGVLGGSVIRDTHISGDDDESYRILSITTTGVDPGPLVTVSGHGRGIGGGIVGGIGGGIAGGIGGGIRIGGMGHRISGYDRRFGGYRRGFSGHRQGHGHQISGYGHGVSSYVPRPSKHYRPIGHGSYAGSLSSIGGPYSTVRGF